jgi:hypothetical protein
VSPLLHAQSTLIFRNSTDGLELLHTLRFISYECYDRVFHSKDPIAGIRLWRSQQVFQRMACNPHRNVAAQLHYAVVFYTTTWSSHRLLSASTVVRLSHQLTSGARFRRFMWSRSRRRPVQSQMDSWSRSKSSVHCTNSYRCSQNDLIEESTHQPFAFVK